MGISSFFGFGTPANNSSTGSTVDKQDSQNNNQNTPAIEDQNKNDQSGMSTAGTENKSPLDQYSDLWQTDKSDKQGDPEPDIFAIDQTKLGEAAGKLDFTKVIKPEQLQAIARGGDEAVNAFAQAMNAVAQATWQSNFATSAKLMEEVFAKKEAELESRISSAIKNQNIDSALSTNPVFKHPAARPVVGAIARAMSAKFPEASPQELQAKAAELLAEIAGGKVNQDQNISQNKADTKTGFTDWDAWIKS